MPKTIEHPKHQTWKSTVGVKPQGFQSKIIEVLAPSKGGLTIKQISTAIQNPKSLNVQKLRTRIAKLEEQLKALNVVEVPKVILPELHDAATGRIDAQKVADFMGVPLKQLSEGLGRSVPTSRSQACSSQTVSVSEGNSVTTRSTGRSNTTWRPRSSVRVMAPAPAPAPAGASRPADTSTAASRPDSRRQRSNAA